MLLALKNLTLPPDDQAVWNYMDLQKFLNLIRTGSLFFCRVDKLSDRSEGRVPEATIARWRERIRAGFYTPGGHELTEADLDFYLNDLNRLRKSFLVDCWHESDHESPAMWKMYAENRYGLAIRSTIGRLKTAFAPLDEEVAIGQVNYIEPDYSQLDIQYTYWPVYNKLKYYSYEQEVRITIRDRQWGTPHQRPVGCMVGIGLQQLIQGVYVSPSSTPELQEIISLYLERYGYSIPVERSSIEDLSL